MWSDFRRNLSFWGLLVLSPFPVYTYGMVSFALGAFLIMGVVSRFLVKSERNKPFNRSELMLETGFFLILLLSWSYSQDRAEGLGLLFRLAPFLLFPLVLRYSNYGPLLQVQAQRIKWAYICANCIVAIYLLLDSIRVHVETGRKFYNVIKESAQRTTFWELHPTYISIFMLMATFLLVDSFNRFERKKYKVVVAISGALLLGSIILLSSRIVLICLLLAGLIYIKSNLGRLVYVLFVSGLVLTMLTFVKPLQFQINEILEMKLELPTEKFPPTVKVRYAINYCSWQSIRDHLLLGVGIGGFQAELETCYSTLQTNALSIQKLNSHNFYFFLWGSAGLLAFLAFIFLLIYKLTQALLQKNRIQTIFWMIILVVNLTESFLTRSFGIMFFVFFLSLFYLDKNNGFGVDNHAGI